MKKGAPNESNLQVRLEFTLTIDGSFQSAAGGAVVATNVAGTNSNVNVSAGATLRMNGDLGDGNDAVTALGTLDLGPATATLALGDGNDALTLGGALLGSAGVALGNGDDSLTGGTVVNAGSLRLAANNALPANRAATVLGLGAGTSSTLDLNGFNATINALTLGGAGSSATSAASVTTGTGTLTLNGNITVNALGTPLAPVISGNLNLGGATRTINFINGNLNTNRLRIDAVIANGGLAASSGTGSATLVLSAANTYAGPTTLAGEFALEFNSIRDVGGGPSALGAPATAANGTISWGYAASGPSILRYTGSGDTTNRVLRMQLGNTWLESSGSGPLVFTSAPVNAFTTASNASLTLAGTNTGANGMLGMLANAAVPLQLHKMGTGHWVLGGGNTYTGSTHVSAGTLTAPVLADGGSASSIGASSASAANLVFDGGTLRYTGATVTIDRGYTLTNNTRSGIEVSDPGTTLTISGATPATTGAFAKRGGGTLVLTGTHLASGTTTIEAGTLKLGGGGAGGSLGSGAIINDATLVFDRGNAYRVDNTISGTGTLTQTGSGTTTLTAPVNAAGHTNVTGGTLEVLNALSSDTLTLGNGRLSIGGSFQAAGGPAVLGNVAGSASTLRVENGGSLRVTGDLGDGDDTVFVAGTLDGGNGAITLGGGGDRLEISDAGAIAAATRLGGGAGADTLVLGGAAGGRFDVGRIDHGIDGFELLRKEGAGTWTLTGTGSPTRKWTIADGIVVADTGSLQGDVVNEGRLVFDQGTDGIHAGALSGTGSLLKTGAGMLDLRGDSTMTGPATVARGRLQVTGSIASPVTVNAGAELGGTGVVRGKVGNAGTVRPGTSARLGTLTVQGDYEGLGGQLDIRSVLGGGDAATDRLLVDGGRASGSTRIKVRNQGGLGGLTGGQGIQIVGLANGATSSASAFVLVAPVVAGPFQYELFQDAHEGWYLRSKDNRPVEVSPPSAGPDLPVPPAAVAALPRVVAAASPEVSLNNALAARAQNLGLQALATADTRQGRTRGGGTHHWARAFATDGRVRGGGLQARGADFDYGGGGVQAGVDTPLWRGDAIEDRIGGYASAGGQQASVMHFDGSAAGRNTLRARGVGSYWTRTSNEGWYLDAVGQYLRYAQVRTRSVQGIAGQTTGWGAATSLEAGRSIPLDARTRVEPQAQWIVQRAHLDGLRDSHGNAVRLGGSTSVLGRVGARVVRDWGEANPGDPAGSAWLRVNAWHEFAGRSAARYDTANGALAYRRDMGGTWGELEIGFRASLSSGTSFHASVGTHHGLGGTRREGTSASGGGATGLGLSMQLTRNARLSSGLAYDSGAGTDGGLNARVALDLKW